MDPAAVATAVGGVGLFLLGMHLLSDGLRLAAGGALSRILARCAGSPLRGLVSGAVLTALVQSSSAVTVATIGFVNAGWLTLSQALFVIFGSNLGTTLTGWLVAGVGFEVNLRAAALPVVGVGMLVRLLAGERRVAHLASAVAGMGVFFLGLDALKGGFAGVGDALALERLAAGGPAALALLVGAGFLLTLLTQSSSAAIAVVLTAAAGGALPLDLAAAAVIGANIGTTSTAALSAVGATPDARRVAAGHLAFNLLTGAVALAALPFLLRALEDVARRLELGTGAPALLAAFHTAFNVLGVLLLWPLTPRLVRLLERLFRTEEEDEAVPRHLDRSALATPAAALEALARELGRVGAVARRMARQALAAPPPAHGRMAAERGVVDRLVEAVGAYAARVGRERIAPDVAGRLPEALRVARYHAEVAELAAGVAERAAAALPLPEALAREVAAFSFQVQKLLDDADPDAPEFDPATCAAQRDEAERSYHALKARLLTAGARGELPVRRTVDELDRLSDVRRIVQQVDKGARALAALRAGA